MDSHQQRVYGSLTSLFAGGQFKDWSIPVAEARAIIGVAHAINSDEDYDDHTSSTNKRGRTDTASVILPRKKSNMDMEAPPDNVHKLKHINKRFYWPLIGCLLILRGQRQTPQMREWRLQCRHLHCKDWWAVTLHRGIDIATRGRRVHMSRMLSAGSQAYTSE